MFNKIFLIFFASTLILNTQIMAIETPKYQTLIKEGKFEIRDYDPMIIAITSVNSNYSNAASVVINDTSRHGVLQFKEKEVIRTFRMISRAVLAFD